MGYLWYIRCEIVVKRSAVSDEIQMCCRRENLRGMWVDDRGWGCRCVPGQPGVVNNWVVWSGAMSFHLGYWWSVLKGNNCGVRGAVTQILCFLLLTPHMQRHAQARQSWVDWGWNLILLTHITDERVEGVVYRYVGHLALSRWHALLGWLAEHRVICHWWPLELHTHTQKEKNRGSYLDRLQLLTEEIPMKWLYCRSKEHYVPWSLLLTPCRLCACSYWKTLCGTIASPH